MNLPSCRLDRHRLELLLPWDACQFPDTTLPIRVQAVPVLLQGRGTRGGAFRRERGQRCLYSATQLEDPPRALKQQHSIPGSRERHRRVVFAIGQHAAVAPLSIP